MIQKPEYTYYVVYFYITMTINLLQEELCFNLRTFLSWEHAGVWFRRRISPLRPL